MIALMLLAAAAASASCPAIAFEFQGQPSCVELRYQDATTRAHNGCSQPLLLDHSVVLEAGAFLVQPDTTGDIRDLSAFTLGMDGKLYQVVATLAEQPACREPGDTGEPREG